MDFLEKGNAKTYESKDALPLLYGYGADPDTTYDLTEERARLAHHQANNEKLKEDQLRGSLIPEDIIKEHGAGMVAAFRAKLLSLHNKIRNKFTSLSKDVIDEIQRLHQEALEELGTDGIPSEIRERIRRNLSGSDTTSRPDD
jgi:phage terminase Nu1 subunit (DNA packaging protein)